MKNVFFKVTILLLVFSHQPALAQFSKLKLKAPKKPTVVYDRMDVKSINMKKARVEFVYIVTNPNSFGVDHILADYEFFLKGKPTAKGKDVKFTIPAKSKQEFKLPLEINYLDAFKSAGALTKAIAGGKKSIPFQMDITFKIELKVLKFDIPITTKGDLPLPKPKSVKKMKLKKKKLKF
ncbi:MAG: LEA type 2 family protein [Candidatus Marinimicrobia bacterium]|nr:LEA type 2 family protein [Candidatus Neomarinimicrobiota bacterium]MBT3631255.1 LEA type 2 family protein [Candidatus Neomarinimicrobiota bacterium]MBT3824763.1 LEA type 2 family protein [Candidatus Neomarinimicrobiota bacterium]MBT4132041.1 LEA type 2 family protein [Candidatus Neomarinimicrobiota bacterium]MBT4296156.1 LEA type 2 family protein [Candidatus Neomarinimicrobiota bacterium]